MRLTQLLHMTGGKGQFTAYFHCLRILVHGHGNSGVAGEKIVGFRNSSSLNTTILASDLADHELCTRNEACACYSLESFGGWFKSSVKDREAWIYSLCLPLIDWLSSYGNPQVGFHAVKIELGWFQGTASGYYQLGMFNIGCSWRILCWIE